MNWNMSYYLCLPNKTFEYIQAGLPIASSDFPELRNIVEGYQIGVLFDPDNSRQMAEQIQRYFDSPELQQACAANLKTAKEALCWETEEQKLIDLYAALS
jgi:glycosyltransferase involved in cell wall biosynthesis